ncbi:hypothetical protein [Burkholderia sp. Bp9142]|uniref:hypothetical protein n=1 Tax=Burkholderia sp. Bp9142 TaxID=2184573 RepID=UPI000F5A0A66|nr:hypothetical protein [Burkholderia sp. Bp9142]RQR28803.1 hypothetical protein DIE22_27825 [Burkholderia sp. Bp9142]
MALISQRSLEARFNFNVDIVADSTCASRAIAPMALPKAWPMPSELHESHIGSRQAPFDERNPSD